MVDFSNLGKKLVDAASSDILAALHEQNQLLTKLVAYNSFEQSDTDKVHIINFDFGVLLPAAVATLNQIIIPAKIDYEIHLYRYFVTPTTRNMMFFTLHGGTIQEPKPILVGNLGLSTEANPWVGENFNKPIIFKEGIEVRWTWVTKTPPVVGEGNLTVNGVYYSRKAQPSWTSQS